MKRIDFLTVQNQYSSTFTFTDGLRSAFERLGVRIRVFPMDTLSMEGLSALLQDPADMTLSFSYVGFSTEEKDMFIGDYLKRPHFTYWVDGAIFSLPLLRSPYNYVSVVDRLDYQGLKSIGEDKLLFLPHAVEYEELSMQEKCYDIVMSASFLDFEDRKTLWKYKYSEHLCKVMHLCCNYVLTDATSSISLCLERALNECRYSLLKESFADIYFEIEYYCKGKDRLQLLYALKEFDVHVFGPSDWTWALKDLKNVILHSPLSYIESLATFEKSKVVLNSSPQFRHGSHERVFNSLAKGAVVITNENSYLEEQFHKDSGLLYYHPDKTEELCLQLRAMLSCEELRKSAALKGYSLVMKEHTWDVRAAQILKILCSQ
ncbi:MAG: glycosyltransferase [Chlamydiales bacterium]|nr:glycosyltransferase [Chlamydiales bacterium]